MDYDLQELAADPRYAHIRVCLEHGGLYEDRPDPETGRQQRCHDRSGVPTWDRYDFNEWIRLCDCCLAVPLYSGSRWSLFFCSHCKTELVAAQLGIPIGRHTIMNRIEISDSISMFDAIDRLHMWKALRVRHLIDATDDPQLADMLDANNGPSTAVPDLLHWWNDPSSTGDIILEP